MTVDKIIELFETYEDDFLKFDKIPAERRLSKRPDLNAFMLLDTLVPETEDIVCCAEHDQIYPSVNLDKLTSITEEQVSDLRRCGLFIENDGLSMFV